MVDNGFLSQEEIDALFGKNETVSDENLHQEGFQSEAEEEQVVNLDLIMDFPLQLSVRLGGIKKSLRELMQISPGTVIELDRHVSEHVDIYINNKLIARGEVIVVDENYGVKIAHIIEPLERIKKLA
ncbi:MAG: flagellar motor switch protein FliN [Dethiobacteria bacterium]|jgi:flagellar motor switch protein FliN/FliY